VARATRTKQYDILPRDRRAAFASLYEPLHRHPKALRGAQTIGDLFVPSSIRTVRQASEHISKDCAPARPVIRHSLPYVSRTDRLRRRVVPTLRA